MSTTTSTKEILTKDGKVVVQETIKTVNTDRGVTTKTTTTILEGRDLTEAFKQMGIDESVIKDGEGKMSTSTRTVTKTSGGKVVKKNFDSQKDLDNFMKEFRDGKITEISQVQGIDNIEAVSEVVSAEAEKVSEKNLNKGSGKSNFAEKALERHNYWRKIHGVEPLVLNHEITKYSQEWADNLAAKSLFMHRSPPHKYGENIYMQCNSQGFDNDSVCKQAIDTWYREIDTYVFDKEPKTLKEGHFTQIVWSDCKELGMAKAIDNKNRIYIVANYSPQGNIMGKFANNVPRPINKSK